MRSWKRKVWTAAVIVLAAGCRGGGDDGGAAEVGSRSSRRAAREDTSPGALLYRRSCIMCHGERGAGTQLGPPLAGGAGRTAEAVAPVVREGVAAPQTFPVPMPPRGDGTFDEKEIETVSEYVESLGR